MSARQGLSVHRELESGPPYEYIEYTSVPTTLAIQGYAIGSVNYAAEPGRLPRFFIAKKIMVYCNQNAQLRFNNARAAPVFVPAGRYIGFDVLTAILYYQRDTVNGTLQIWVQG